jgi:hypothetical protein
MMNFLRVNKKKPCAICGRNDWCGYSADGDSAICMRVKSDRASANGGWLHRVGFATPKPTARSVAAPQMPTAHADRKDAIYCALLKRFLVLSADHRARLRLRGLDAERIERGGYRSNPAPVYVRAILKDFSDDELRGVPGFYFEGGRRMVDCGAGFFIPARDERGRIRALQFRRDEGKPKYFWFSSASKPHGASSGSPLHFANRHLLDRSDEVILTEGILKADCVAHFTGLPVIAAAGVSNFPPGFEGNLREQYPNINRAVVAFDSDFISNEQVKSALRRIVDRLRRAHFSTVVRTWDRNFKGYDDFLLSERTTRAA